MSLNDTNIPPVRTFTGAQLSEIAFPLGGIGTGTISLGGRGNLRDFEIFNRPAKGNVLPQTHFALWASAPGQAPVAKLLEGKVPPPYRKGAGEAPGQLTGVARFAEVTFHGEYPVATLELTDPEMPVRVSLRAWNPFIPLNVKDSALPVAIFEWTITNPTDAPVEVSLAASLANPLTKKNAEGKPDSAGSLNAYRDNGTAFDVHGTGRIQVSDLTDAAARSWGPHAEGILARVLAAMAG